MKRQDFEKELQEIDSHLNIKDSPQAPDMAGISYDDCHICGIPSGDIFDEESEDYKDLYGNKHRTRMVALALVNKWLENKDAELKLDAEVKALIKK